jgi:hypothetical protein
MLACCVHIISFTSQKADQMGLGESDIRQPSVPHVAQAPSYPLASQLSDQLVEHINLSIDDHHVLRDWINNISRSCLVGFYCCLFCPRTISVSISKSSQVCHPKLYVIPTLCIIPELSSSPKFVLSQTLPHPTSPACRNQARGDAAAAAISEATGNSSVRCMLCDLASLRSVREFAENYQKTGQPLDVLVRCLAELFMEMRKLFGTSGIGYFCGIVSNMQIDL